MLLFLTSFEFKIIDELLIKYRDSKNSKI